MNDTGKQYTLTVSLIIIYKAMLMFHRQTMSIDVGIKKKISSFDLHVKGFV